MGDVEVTAENMSSCRATNENPHEVVEVRCDVIEPTPSVESVR
jgi:hypothetical protein